MDDTPDIVYTWAGLNNSIDNRQRHNNELFYSIKSVLLYLPWCKNIYIMVNRDISIPQYILNLHNDKIKRIDRSSLFEQQQHSMTKNSFAVYSLVDKIPGLNNRFILFDDDFMVLRHLSISHFFNKKKPIVRLTHEKHLIYNTKIKLPNYIKDSRPFFKFRGHSHIPMPCTKEIIKQFRYKYPKYNLFVQSHVTRFHKCSEDIMMIYYQFAYDNDMIILKQGLFDFFQIMHFHYNCAFLFALEFIFYYIVFCIFPYKYFNINDDWSYTKHIYNKQMKILKIFYYMLYG